MHVKCEVVFKMMTFLRRTEGKKSGEIILTIIGEKATICITIIGGIFCKSVQKQTRLDILV